MYFKPCSWFTTVKRTDTKLTELVETDQSPPGFELSFVSEPNNWDRQISPEDTRAAVAVKARE